MISSIIVLANMKANDEGVIMTEDAKVTATKDEYDTTFEIESRSQFYSKSASVPNSLIETLANDMLSYSTVSNRTSTILYYMAGYRPYMTLKELTTVDYIIGSLL